MLAKVPVRRLDRKSSFAALVRYVTKDAATISHSPEIWAVETAAGEMEQVASFSRARDPVYHYVLSWREGEQPTDAQAFDAVNATLTALRMQDNQWLVALHRNTHNIHAHVAVNRVHPQSYKAIAPFRDWLVLDRACREIELKHGWSHDKGPHRVELGNGKPPQVVRTLREPSNESPALPSTRARDYATWNGRESFQEWLGNEPARSLKEELQVSYASWHDVHKVLRRFNLEYRVRGSGAVIVDRSEPENLHAKACHLGRFASRGKLEARLGPYEGRADAPMQELIKTYRMDDEKRELAVGVDAALYGRFKQVMAEWTKTQAGARADVWQQQREHEGARWVGLLGESRATHQQIRESKPAYEQQVQYSIAAIGAALKREELRSQIREERRQLRAQLAGRSPGPWRAWLARESGAGDLAAAKELRRLRYRLSGDRQIDQPQVEIGAATSPEMLRDAVLQSLKWTVSAAGVNYQLDGRTCFRDEGRRVVFHDLGDDQIRAGLALAREKWPDGIYLTGTDSFRKKATSFAARMQIAILSGGLQRSDPPDLDELSRRYDKPIFESKLALGRRHSGKLVAVAVDTSCVGIVVIDAGRQLALIQTDVKTALELRPMIGQRVRADAGSAQSRGHDHAVIAWRVRKIEREGLELGLGIQ